MKFILHTDRFFVTCATHVTLYSPANIPCVTISKPICVPRAAVIVRRERQSRVWGPAEQRFPVCNRKERSDIGVPSERWCGGVAHGGPLLCPTQHWRWWIRPCGGTLKYHFCVHAHEPLLIQSFSLTGVRSEYSVEGRRYPSHWRCCVYIQRASVPYTERKVNTHILTQIITLKGVIWREYMFWVAH